MEFLYLYISDPGVVLLLLLQFADLVLYYLGVSVVEVVGFAVGGFEGLDFAHFKANVLLD